MDVGYQTKKIFKTEIPLTEPVWNGKKVIQKTVPNKYKEYHLTTIDKCTNKAPQYGYFKVYEDEKVGIYQRERALNRIFVIKQWDKNKQTSLQPSKADSQEEMTTK